MRLSSNKYRNKQRLNGLVWGKWNCGKDSNLRYRSAFVTATLLEENRRSIPALELSIYLYELEQHVGKFIIAEPGSMKVARWHLGKGIDWAVGYVLEDKDDLEEPDDAQ